MKYCISFCSKVRACCQERVCHVEVGVMWTCVSCGCVCHVDVCVMWMWVSCVSCGCVCHEDVCVMLMCVSCGCVCHVDACVMWTCASIGKYSLETLNLLQRLVIQSHSCLLTVDRQYTVGTVI